MSHHAEPMSTEEDPLLPSPESPNEEETNDSNQSVTMLRALCIIASLGVLIFLQGRFARNLDTTRPNS